MNHYNEVKITQRNAIQEMFSVRTPVHLKYVYTFRFKSLIHQCLSRCLIQIAPIQNHY